MLYPRRLEVKSTTNRNSNTFTNSLLSPSRLENKKRSLVEKLSIALKLKYSQLFKEKCYNTLTLIADLNEIIDLSELERFDYNSCMNKISRIILEKVNCMRTIIEKDTKTNLPEMMSSRIYTKPILKDLHLEMNNSMDHKIMNSQSCDRGDFPEEYKDYFGMKNTKLFELRLKEKDEWGIKAKQSYQTFLEEKSQNKMRSREKYHSLMSVLENQITEKKIREQQVAGEEENFFQKLQDENNRRFDQKERDKKQIQKEKYIDVEKNRQRFLVEQKVLEHDKELKIKLLEEQNHNRFRSEVQREHQKVLDKKQKESENLRHLNEVRSLRAKMSDDMRLREMEEEERTLKESNQILDRLDQQRENFKTNVKTKFQKNLKILDNSKTMKNKQLLSDIEENRYRREIWEQEKKLKEDEEKKRRQKMSLTKQMTNCLDDQVKKKLRNLESERDMDFIEYQKYNDEAEKVRAEKVNQKNQQDSLKAHYKKDLEELMTDKINRKIKPREELITGTKLTTVGNYGSDE